MRMVLMPAPRRLSSSTTTKRFSNTFSVTMDVPSAGERSVAAHGDRPVALPHVDSHAPELAEEELEVPGVEAHRGDFSTSGGAHDEIRARLDAIRHDLVVHAVQRVTALDADGAGAGALDHCPHAPQEVAEIDDLGLSRGVLDDRLAVCGRGGHDEVLGGADAGVVERDDGPLELRAADLDEAVVDRDGRSELLEAADVEVDAPRPDVAAAGHSDGGLAEARHQGAHDDDAGAHGAH